MTASAGAGDSELLVTLRRLQPHRSPRLFRDFLPRGYALTALGPSGAAGEAVLRAKVLLGSLITFHDDLADHPQCYDAEALAFLYGQTRQLPRAPLSRRRIAAAQRLERAMEAALADLEFYEDYAELLRFDLDQIFAANRYSALQRRYDGLGNLAEVRHFGPFNMGMIAAGTIDLMQLGTLRARDLAAVREATYLGQRAGRISNVVTTLERERREGDLTNEVFVAVAGGYDGGGYLTVLTAERRQLVAQIAALAPRTAAVDLKRYAAGVEALHHLHVAFGTEI
jgi:hypothetical protein